MRHVWGSILLIVVVASVGACSAAGGGGTGGTIEGPVWQLTSQMQGDAAAAVPDGVFVDARFKGGAVAGSDGCNVYNGQATISGATIKVGPLATTERACEGPASDVEQAYLANLAKAASFTATSDALTIFDGSGATILEYKAGPANPLEGDWIVTGYNNGEQAVVGPVEGTTLTVTFTADTVSGSSGCNTFTGGYTLEGDKVTVDQLAGTMKACEQPVMDQEARLLAALQVPATVESSGGTVTLRDASGATQVTLAPKQ